MERYRESMREEDMLAALHDYTLREGGLYFHVRNARDQELVGLPDALIFLPPKYGVRPGTAAFFEVKTQGDRITPRQREVMRVIGQVTEIAHGFIRPRPRSPLEITLDDALELLGKDPG
jgi:hypothetical protein